MAEWGRDEGTAKGSGKDDCFRIKNLKMSAPKKPSLPPSLPPSNHSLSQSETHANARPPTYTHTHAHTHTHTRRTLSLYPPPFAPSPTISPPTSQRNECEESQDTISPNPCPLSVPPLSPPFPHSAMSVRKQSTAVTFPQILLGKTDRQANTRMERARRWRRAEVGRGGEIGGRGEERRGVEGTEGDDECNGERDGKLMRFGSMRRRAHARFLTCILRGKRFAAKHPGFFMRLLPHSACPQGKDYAYAVLCSTGERAGA